MHEVRELWDHKVGVDYLVRRSWYKREKNTLESSKGVHAQSDDCKLKGEKPDKNKIAFDCISHK